MSYLCEPLVESHGLVASILGQVQVRSTAKLFFNHQGLKKSERFKYNTLNILLVESNRLFWIFVDLDCKKIQNCTSSGTVLERIFVSKSGLMVLVSVVTLSAVLQCNRGRWNLKMKFATTKRPHSC